MNVRTLRRLFAKLSESAASEGTDGLLALANVGDTQSHAHEVVAEKLAALPKASRPKNAVFWHHQSHARAFDADGELVAPLALHWIGSRARIGAALEAVLGDAADVTLSAASSDRVAFALVPRKTKASRATTAEEMAAATEAAAPKRPPKAQAARSTAASTAAATLDASRIQVSKLADTPETEARLVQTIASGDGRAVLASLQVLLRFAQQRDEKEATKRRKAGTESAFYEELGARPGPFPPAALDALAGNVTPAAALVDDKTELAFRIALRQALKGQHPRLGVMLDAALSASSWRTRRAVAELGSYPGAAPSVLSRRLEALLSDGSTDVVSAACRSLAALAGTSESLVMIELLLRDEVDPTVRAWLFWSLAHTELSPAERVKARPLAARPAFATNEHLAQFRRATA